MPGKRPHYEILDVFATPKDALDWIAPQRERIWEDVSAGVVAFVSRGTSRGSVPTRA